MCPYATLYFRYFFPRSLTFQPKDRKRYKKTKATGLIPINVIPQNWSAANL